MLNGIRALWAHRAVFAGRRLLLVIGLLAAVIESALVIPVPWLVAHAIDAGLPRKNRSVLIWSSIGVLACTTASIVYGILAKAAIMRVTRHGTARFRRLCTDRLVDASRQFHTDADEAQLHDVLVSNAGRMDELATTLLSDSLPAVLTAAGLVVALLIVNPILTLVTAALVPMVVFTHTVFRRRRTQAVVRFHQAFEGVSAGVFRLLRSDEMIRMDGTHDVVRAQQAVLIGNLERDGRRMLVLNAAHDGAQLTAGAAVATTILVVGGLLVIDDRLQVGALVSFYAAFGLLRRPVSQLAKSTALIHEGAVAMDHIDAFLEAADHEPYTGTTPVLSIHSVDFDQVHFGYPGRSAIITDLSLHLERGHVLGVAGPNGSGKSTVVHLLLGLYRPTAGEVRVNGWTYEEVRIRDLRARIGVVAQHPVFSPGTVEENLRLGIHHGPLQEALRISGADAVVAELPDGLATRIGDDGVRLSGGQRQRLAIARALLRHPDVLVLDEPTLHLDAATVAVLLHQLRTEVGPAVLLVSHQPDVLDTADEVLTLGPRSADLTPRSG